MVYFHRSSRSLLAALLLVLGVVVAVGCSTAPDAADQQEQLIEETGIQDLLQSEDVLMAAAVTADELSSLTPLFQRLAQSADHDAARELADISPDPIRHISRMHDLPNELEALAHDRPSYILLTHRGNDRFLEAAGLGLPTERDEWPAYFNVRVLLPTGDSDELQQQLNPWLDELVADPAIGGFELYDGPGFVRLEMAVANQGPASPGAVDADQWLADLNLENVRPPAQANYRETPAYRSFIDADATFALWAPTGAFSRMAVMELLDLFAREHAMIGDLGKPQHFLEGVARVSAASVADDPMVAEHEDLSLLMNADDDGTLIVDYYTTRTDHGIELREAMDQTIQLPGFAAEDSFLNIAFQGDADAVEQLGATPYWTRFEDDGPNLEAGFDPAAEPVEESMLPFSDDPALFPVLAMATQYPRTAFASGSDTIADFMPLPRALALESFTTQGLSPIPLGAAAAAAFEATPQNRMAIEQLLGFADGMLPGHFDAELIDRDDDLMELKVAFGAELDDIFDRKLEPKDIDELEFSLHVAPIQQLAGLLPGSEAVGLFDYIHMRGHGEDHYQTYRFTIGAEQALAPQPVNADTEPLANPSNRCRTEMAGLAVEHLADLRGDSAAQIDRWADELTDIAGRCLSAEDPRIQLIQERIDLARKIGEEIP